MIMGTELSRFPFVPIRFLFGGRSDKWLFDKDIKEMKAISICKSFIVVKYFTSIFRLYVVQNSV